MNSGTHPTNLGGLKNLQKKATIENKNAQR